jgi:serine beta-lactamase-like protein LACTB, mitochondrial
MLSGQTADPRGAAWEKAAAAHIEKHRIPALSVAVLTPEGSIWKGAWGFADLENFVPAKPASMFRLASVSKTLTAVAAMKLVEEGKLDLDAPVQKYLPSFPEKAWPVTTRQLLAHLGGIRHYKGDDFNSTKHYWTVPDALEMFAADPLTHEPGTKYLYSTYGYVLAGAVLEKASGEPYAQLIRRVILTPSGTDTTRTDDLYSIIPNRVRGYRKQKDGSIDNTDLADTSNKIPGGGWISNAEDLVRYSRALMSGKLLQPATMQAMWTPLQTADGKSTGYGLGWGVWREGSNLAVGHSGGQQGANTYLLLIPEKKIAVAVLANLEDARCYDLAREIALTMVNSQ